MAIRVFQTKEMHAAIAYAKEGGQAVHLHQIVFPTSPLVFRKAVAAGQHIAHLFDQDKARLLATAARLGVRVRIVERTGTDRQHIDLCGQPLRKLLIEAESQIVEGERA